MRTRYHVIMQVCRASFTLLLILHFLSCQHVHLTFPAREIVGLQVAAAQYT
jgi:hypothetical protein